MLNIDFTEGGWFDGLPNGQQKLIGEMLNSADSEDALGEMWLARPGSPTNAGFGGDNSLNAISFYANVKAEVVSFLCGGQKYEKERNQASEIWNKGGKPGLVTYIAVSVSPHVGYAVVVILPVVALVCSLMSKVTIGAFCATFDKSIPPDVIH